MLLAIEQLSVHGPGDDRAQEILTIASIYPELRILTPHSATISIPVAPITPLPVAFADSSTISVSHLPPLEVCFDLPETYPAAAPPSITLSTSPPWIPGDVFDKLTAEVDALWEEYGRCEVVFTIIDHVQQAAERAFDISVPTLPLKLKEPLAAFNQQAKQEAFDAGTYDCGICLEPRKGRVCHRIHSCGHVFCKACLVDYYGSCIKEGDVSSVGCIDPSCKKATKKEINGGLPATLPPDEVRDIGIDEAMVSRYEMLKLKGALEKDPDTIWCPRSWCQAPSRESVKALNEAMKAKHTTHYLMNLEDLAITKGEPVTGTEKEQVEQEDKESEGKPNMEKLHVCSKCEFAFCRVCQAGWHGYLVACRLKDAPLTEEELATEEYLKTSTTPCPTCTSPVLKSFGCNHVICKCGTHFCYLCSAYLDPETPYTHFNSRGSTCYMRLFEGEEGDDEQRQINWERRLNGEEPIEIVEAAALIEQEERGGGRIDNIGDVEIIFEEDPHQQAAPPGRGGGRGRRGRGGRGRWHGRGGNAQLPPPPREQEQVRNIGIIEVRWNGNVRVLGDEGGVFQGAHDVDSGSDQEMDFEDVPSDIEDGDW